MKLERMIVSDQAVISPLPQASEQALREEIDRQIFEMFGFGALRPTPNCGCRGIVHTCSTIA